MRLIFISFFVALSFSACAQVRSQDTTLFSIMPHNDLKGTYVLPAKGKKFDLVVIQAGSGPTDRNGNSPLGVKANSYRLLANELAEKNIAVLLTDKRGIAGSAAAMKKEIDLRFEDYANDLADWIRFAKKDKRFKKIFIAGHSEGSLVGMLAAEQEKVDGYISIAGAGEPIDKILVWQITQQNKENGIILDSLLQKIKKGEKVEKAPPALVQLLYPAIQPYMRSWMQYDPCAEIKKIKAPVMIIQGSTDLQVEIKEAQFLHACRPKAAYKIIEGMNHILKASPLEREKNFATYNDPALPLMPGLAEIIAAFVKK